MKMEVSRDARSRVSATDFSIDRILGNDPHGSAPPPESAPAGSEDSPLLPRVSAPPPPWLFCSRYQPPKIPRMTAGDGCRGRSRRAGRHARVPFTAAQSAALESAFERAPYLAPPALRALANALHLREDRIKIWFQNRRARERREKSVFPPSQAVSMPAPGTLLRPTIHTFANVSCQPRAVNVSPRFITVTSFDLEAIESTVDVETIDDVPDQIIPKR